MGVKPQDLCRLMSTPQEVIFATIADLYGTRIADDVAKKCLDKDYRPHVSLPRL